MKSILLLVMVISTTAAMAQTQASPFRRKYTRLGIQTPGSQPVTGLSPKENLLKGNFGTEMGYVFEKGRLFYFMPAAEAKLLNVGLDWTIVSFQYSPSANSWDKYARQHTTYSVDDFSAQTVASLSTRLGPVLSINPVQDLVVDLRVQLGLGAYFLGPLYESTGSSSENGVDHGFYGYKDDTTATGVKKFTQLFNSAFKPSLGATVRWRTFGLAVDYSPGKMNMHYKAIDNKLVTTGVQKVPLNTFQIKLTINGK